MKKAIAIILLLVVAITVAVLFNRSDHKAELERYNGGICTECGGTLEQRGTWTDRADGTEFNRFVCDHCHEVYLFRFIGNEKK